MNGSLCYKLQTSSLIRLCSKETMQFSAFSKFTYFLRSTRLQFPTMSSRTWANPQEGPSATTPPANIKVVVPGPGATFRMARFGTTNLFRLPESAKDEFDSFILPCLVRIFAETTALRRFLLPVKEIRIHPCMVRYRTRFLRLTKEVNGLVIEVSGHSLEAKRFARAAKYLIDSSRVCKSEGLQNKFQVFVQDEPAGWEFNLG
ncbi:hypothetical protein QBC43DRAFT_351168 [Cladorrhinum sp. PSN259]|nr:hypothetical protein QBC43DRAFT_351168 [Cladorrhinum sp. PSN259]